MSLMFTFEPIMDTVLSALSMLLVYRTSTIDTFFANDTSLEIRKSHRLLYLECL